MLKYSILAVWLVYWLCYPVKSHVTCGVSTMIVEIDKPFFQGVNVNNLRLNDPTNIGCSLDSNDTHVFVVIPLNACGTLIEENEENLIFKNEITMVDHKPDQITRKCLKTTKISCQYSKRGSVTRSYNVHRENVTVWDRGFGTFTYNFEFYRNKQFVRQFEAPTYPLLCDLATRIYMQIDATASDTTELFVESCRAAPYDNPDYSPSYPIIEHGCDKDVTVERHQATNKRQFRFSVEAFKFIGMYDQVYISCSVMMCEAEVPGTRCSQGCIGSRARRGNNPHHLNKREAVPQSSRHFISQGPLRLKRSPEITGRPIVVNLNMSLVFIAGCVLAAVGMICAVAMYKVKMSKVKYQPLPAYAS